MHNGDGKTLISFIYSIKYLNAPFLPYESLLDTPILIISTLSILVKCLYLWSKFLLILSSPKMKIFFLFYAM